MYLMIKKPAYQALLFFLLTLVIILVFQPRDADKAWLIASYMFILFLVINAGLLWFNNNSWPYFFYSICFAMVYMLLIAFIMPGLLNALQLKGSGESAMGFLIMIYQPPVLLVVMLAKWMMAKWL
ncbi:hypothetical protein MASR2M41_23460 [Flammeovirgaceae bacterium]